MTIKFTSTSVKPNVFFVVVYFITFSYCQQDASYRALPVGTCSQTPYKDIKLIIYTAVLIVKQKYSYCKQ